jgi:two-component system LytT family sensor kinase
MHKSNKLNLKSFSFTKLLIANSAWWLMWFMLQSLIIYNAGFKLEIAAIDALVSILLLTAACCATIMASRYYQENRKAWQNMFVWSATLSVVWLYVSKIILEYLFVSQTNYLTFIHNTLLIRYCMAFLMISAAVLLSWIWQYVKHHQQEDARNADIQALAKEAELSKLRQQLQPHFLFNSLNSISALTTKQPAEAKRMIQLLSDFLRGTLKREAMQQVTLQEEIEQLQLYLDIEKVRFGHRLITKIEVNEQCYAMYLPSLLLQPILENAIKFGLYDNIGEVIISIEVGCANNFLQLIIKNPYSPEMSKVSTGIGFGLSAVQRRLYLLFARRDLLETTALDNIFITKVKIPQ